MFRKKFGRRKAIKLGALSALSSATLGDAASSSQSLHESEVLIDLSADDGPLSAQEVVDAIEDEGIEDTRIAGDLDIRKEDLESNSGDIVGYQLTDLGNSEFEDVVYRKEDTYFEDFSSVSSVLGDQISLDNSRGVGNNMWEKTEFRIVYESDPAGVLNYRIAQNQPSEDVDAGYAVTSEIDQRTNGVAGTPAPWYVGNGDSYHDFSFHTGGVKDATPGYGPGLYRGEISADLGTNGPSFSFSRELDGLAVSRDPQTETNVVGVNLQSGFLPLSGGIAAHATTGTVVHDELVFCEAGLSATFLQNVSPLPPYPPANADDAEFSRRLFQPEENL